MDAFGAKIGGTHFGVVFDGRDVTFRQNTTEVHDSDVLGDFADEGHVVLDDQEGVSTAQAFDDLGGLDTTWVNTTGRVLPVPLGAGS